MNLAAAIGDRSSAEVEEPRFVSFAQNFEDVMLWRALGHLENGFYVDVGAQDPVLDSVSKAFYDRGWVGVDIEPVPKYAALLRTDRPRNRVLECALSDRAGREPLFVFGDSGLSTLLSDQAERNQDRLGLAFETRDVEVRTLRDVLAEVSREVHWLKIDVEGAEEEVLRSWQGSEVHPWIVVVEATRPNEREPSHHGWEPLLIEAGYRFAYFDGLNRFYVAPEHPELHRAFSAPPNVFDRFTLAAVDRLDRSFLKAERYAKSLEAEVSTQHDAVRAELDAHRSVVARREEELHEAAVYAASLEAELSAHARHTLSIEEELGRARIEIASQRGLAERRGIELRKAATYAASLEAELEARGVRLGHLDEELDRFRQSIETIQIELDSQRALATRRNGELEEAAVYAASLDEELRRVRQAIDQTGTELDSQRALATRRNGELEEAGIYAASLEAELARLRAALDDGARDASARADAFVEVERYALSLATEVGAQSTRIGELDHRYAQDLARWQLAIADLRRALDASDAERARLTEFAEDQRLAAEGAASGFAGEVEALRGQLTQWQALAIQQMSDWRRQTHTLASLVGMVDETARAGTASMTGDTASARATHEETQAHQLRLNAEIGRIAAELRRHEQRWYRRLSRRLRADRPAS